MTDFCLKPGTVLRSPKRNYTIIKELGHGGFGITYLVEGVITIDNISVPVRFALKEHYINTMCSRDPQTQRVVVISQTAQAEVSRSLHAFVSEANRLQELGISHPNIVKVNEVFEANDTAYFVMEYLDGGSLADYVKQRGRLSFEEMVALMEPVCNSVALLHRNHVAHYDIKPQNIMLVNDNGQMRTVLIDFGLAKHYDGQGNATSSIAAAGFTPGYAPVEQYGGFTTFQATADVYALAATILFCLTGHAPAYAQELNIDDVRNELGNLGICNTIINSLLPAFEYRPKDRPADAGVLAAAVFGCNAAAPSQSTVRMQPAQRSTAAGNPSQQATTIERQQQQTRHEAPTSQPRPKWLKPALIAGGVVLATIVAYTLIGNGEATTDTTDTVAIASAVVPDSAPAEVVITEPENEAPDATEKAPDAPTSVETPKPVPVATVTANPAAQQAVAESLTPEQMYQKGYNYYHNKQYAEAVDWFRKAAEQGYAEGQYWLGWCYRDGHGVAKDKSMAVYWYRKAAEQGHASGQYWLGFYYYWGQGVAEDKSMAVYWYRKAAEQGLAQYELGECYEYGYGVAKDKSMALYWYRKAAAGYDPRAIEKVQQLESQGYR